MAEWEEWEEETVEVRVANGKVVALHKIRFAAIDEVSMICRWCGAEVEARPDMANPWVHRGGSIVCRDETGVAWVPVNTAAPTVWARGEAEEK